MPLTHPSTPSYHCRDQVNPLGNIYGGNLIGGPAEPLEDVPGHNYPHTRWLIEVPPM